MIFCAFTGLRGLESGADAQRKWLVVGSSDVFAPGQGIDAWATLLSRLPQARLLLEGNRLLTHVLAPLFCRPALANVAWPAEPVRTRSFSTWPRCGEMIGRALATGGLPSVRHCAQSVVPTTAPPLPARRCGLGVSNCLHRHAGRVAGTARDLLSYRDRFARLSSEAEQVIRFCGIGDLAACGSSSDVMAAFKSSV